MTKGSKSRVTNRQAYREHFDQINWGKTPPKTPEQEKTEAAERREQLYPTTKNP